MNLTFFFFYFFSSAILISAIMIILSKNPINSVLFLVLTFCNVTALLFTLELEFIPISFIVIYVGAIAILFLFVIMMLNIKLAELKEQNNHFVPVGIIFSVLFLSEIILLLQVNFKSLILLNQHHVVFLSEYTSMFFLNLSFIN
jgi:NADH-quinone oxidoreductase subunit J